MAIKPVTSSVVTVASAGTAVAVSATATPITSILIEADRANTGNIFVGDSAVDSTNGTELTPGGSISYQSDEPQTDEFILSDFFVDAATNGDKARVHFTKRRL